MNLFDADAYEMLARFIPRDSDAVFVDAGACYGAASERLLHVFPNATVHAFEPLPGPWPDLSRRAGALPGLRPVRAALGSITGEIELRCNVEVGTSSRFAPTDRYLAYWGDKLRAASVARAPCWSLDDWAADNGVDRVDAIKIDVQGMELDVLRGADRLLRESVVGVYSEAQLTPLYEGAATFSDIDLFLRDRGFALHQINEIFSNGPERQSTCCDATWVRADALSALCRRLDDTGARRATEAACAGAH